VRLFLDSSIFLHLLLDGPRADEAEEILTWVEEGEAEGFVTALIVEEVSFKLALAKGSELGISSFWEFKRRFSRDETFRETCLSPVEEFSRYLEGMRGLFWAEVLPGDWREAISISRRFGLLSADALHAAVCIRLGAKMATFDSDFSRVAGLSVVP